MVKVYFDTSIVIALSDLGDEFHRSSVGFVHDLKKRNVKTFIGPPFMFEAAKASELRGNQAAIRLVGALEDYDIDLAEDLGSWWWQMVGNYESSRVLAKRHIIDLMHYASATQLGCRYLASWDEEHFNEKIATRVNKVNSILDLPNLIVGDPFKIMREMKLE